MIRSEFAKVENDHLFVHYILCTGSGHTLGLTKETVIIEFHEIMWIVLENKLAQGYIFNMYSKYC